MCNVNFFFLLASQIESPLRGDKFIGSLENLSSTKENVRFRNIGVPILSQILFRIGKTFHPSL